MCLTSPRQENGQVSDRNRTTEGPLSSEVWEASLLELLRRGPDFLAQMPKSQSRYWETDFYTPPVLGGASLFEDSAPAVYKIQGP